MKINVWLVIGLTVSALAVGYVSGHVLPAGRSRPVTETAHSSKSAAGPTAPLQKDTVVAAPQSRYRMSTKNLFGSEDDPPPPAKAPVVNYAPPQAPVPEDPLQHYAYTGSVEYGDQTFAMIMDNRSKLEAIYSEGDNLEGYTVTAIDPEAVTLHLGAQDRRLTVVDGFNPVPMVAAAPTDVRPNPGTLTEYRDKTYQSFFFQVTGAASGSIWGSGSVYTDDSPLATAAVHSGALKDGESGIVRVTVLPGYDHYDGATSNGVTSQSYAQWQGSYRVDRL